METHRFDLLSFVFGALFAAVGVLGLTEVALITLADLRWIGPAVLVLLGLALVVSAARRDSRDGADDLGRDESTVPADDPDDVRP
ncbi:hypothetical protein [Egicoccus sp. AB-alg2]|uniref:hypothetical protein n=1 Tax=Egicoccus sp. AB-alg2 TaxID=3242693 RepID=UPI00359D0400